MMAACGFVILVLISAAAAHLFSKRAAGGDAGAFWARILDQLSLIVGIPILVISNVDTYPPVHGWLPNAAEWWLLILGAAWLILLVLGIFLPPGAASGRWIAGTLGFSPHRFWVLLFAVPFLPALFFLAPLWLADNVRAALWATVILFLAALGGLSLSASPTSVWAGAQKVSHEEKIALSPWPEEMRSRGVALETITEWQPAPSPDVPVGLAAEWQRRVDSAGSPGVSGELCEAASKLMNALPGPQERVSIVLAPDQCGQEEVVALAATELARRYGETTLIVTACPDPGLARRLLHWLDALGGGNPVCLSDLSDGQRPAARIRPDVLLVDAETLSDSILGQLRGELAVDDSDGTQGLGLSRIGLVVWWSVHDFSGVYAAHVWAVSRRLERLLATRRGSAARALVLARRPRNQEAAFLGFLAHLLPYEQSPEKKNVFEVPADFARPGHLYRLGDRSAFAVKRATEASSLTEWKTYGPPELLSTPQFPLAASPALAGARILDIRPDEVLSLREIICQGGRAVTAGLEQHVALAASDNPYINYLLQNYQQDGQQVASVNLIGAEGHKELVQRHLLLGLREVPDTLTGLRAGFRWEEGTLRTALDSLSQEERLRRSPVRFLDRDGRLQRDSLYANQNPGPGSVRSFRIIGGRTQPPVELRDTDQRDRLLLHLDPERLPLDAYPRRVFQAGGRSYRVQEWRTDARGDASPSRISCRLEDAGVRNWPFSTMRIAHIRSNSMRTTFPGAVRYTARVQYQEDVSGICERDQKGDFNSVGIHPVRTSFPTEALMFDFTKQFPLDQMVCAAAALQYVLPVHTAIEENALRAVVASDMSGTRLALVDLYPGGIGVVGALHGLTWLMPRLFDQAAAWLVSLKSQAAIDEVILSPIFRARSIRKLEPEKIALLFASTGMGQQ